MTIDGDSLLRVIQIALPIAVGIYAWVMGQNKETVHAVAALRELLDTETKAIRVEISAATGRVSKVENEMQHLPDKDMVHRIELGMKDMQTQIGAQAEVVKTVERTMQRVETFLLEVQSQRSQQGGAAAARSRK